MKVLVETDEVVEVLRKHVAEKLRSAGLEPDGNGICVTDDKDGRFIGVELPVYPVAPPKKKRAVTKRKK